MPSTARRRHVSAAGVVALEQQREAVPRVGDLAEYRSRRSRGADLGPSSAAREPRVRGPGAGELASASAFMALGCDEPSRVRAAPFDDLRARLLLAAGVDSSSGPIHDCSESTPAASAAS